MFKDGVEDGKQLAHAGGEGDLLGLAGGAEAPVEGPQDRVPAARDQGAHVENGAYGGSATPDRALAPERAAVAIEGSDANETGDPSSVQGAQLGQGCQKGQGEHWAHPRDALEQGILLPPEGAGMKGIPQVSVQVPQFLLQVGDMCLDPLAQQVE